MQILQELAVHSLMKNLISIYQISWGCETFYGVISTEVGFIRKTYICNTIMAYEYNN